MDPLVVSSAFSLIFVAEMGDKSQLIAMTLARRFRPLPVIIGVLGAFLVLNLMAVWIGKALFDWVPQDLVLLAAGGLFLFFAYRAWQDGDDEGADAGNRLGRSAVLTSFSLIFLAEFGDKTQLAMVALAAGTGDLVSVFAGGTLALWLVSLIGILLGCTLLARLPKAWLHRIAAMLFLLFGLLALAELAGGLFGGPFVA